LKTTVPDLETSIAPPHGELRSLARLGAAFFAASASLVLVPKAAAQDRQAIERSMESAMPTGASCSKGRHPTTCEFRKGGIDYDIEYSPMDEGHAVATIKFAQKNEYRRYLDLLMKFLTIFGVSREHVEACVAEHDRASRDQKSEIPDDLRFLRSRQLNLQKSCFGSGVASTGLACIGDRLDKLVGPGQRVINSYLDDRVL
jgi:hypothetical protein